MALTGTVLLDGLEIIGVGMAAVFVVLVVLMGTTAVLGRWFSEKEIVKEAASSEEVTPAPADVEGDVVAAISVVLARMMAGAPRRRVAAVSLTPRGDPWRLSGRRQSMGSSQGVKQGRSVSGTRPSLRR